MKDEPACNQTTVRPGIYLCDSVLLRAARDADMLVIPMPAPWHPATVCIRPKTQTEKHLERRIANGQR